MILNVEIQVHGTFATFVGVIMVVSTEDAPRLVVALVRDFNRMPYKTSSISVPTIYFETD